MAIYRDFTFNKGIYGRAAEYTDTAAIILAIKNILLSRKGNFPFNPSFGMDIEKYQFDLLDSTKIQEIKSEINQQIARYLPSFQDVLVDVRIIDNAENVDADGRQMIGITVSTRINTETSTTSFLVFKRNGALNVVNETH
jgi:phage baseplate assembly protein W